MEEALHRASVASIFKKGDSTHLANYRPLSLLEAVCKLIAGIIKELTDKLKDFDMRRLSLKELQVSEMMDSHLKYTKVVNRKCDLIEKAYKMHSVANKYFNVLTKTALKKWF